ncbi:MAG TPA: platelet-activating factor acetylhydrolase IB subunit [Isosphaeraceae bacterium]|nr:platelet-activating factor acetylhydrolase IB subunit [Isosphaeraceae bacterium]
MHEVSSTRGRGLTRLILGALSTATLAPVACARGDGKSATTPTPREGVWMAMHEKFVERAKQGDIDLLFLGDSIVQGWRGKDRAGKGPIEVWGRYYGPHNAANFGIGGDRTQNVLWRIENGEVDGIRPKVVVLVVGTNNSRDNTADEIADGIKAIVSKLRQKLPESKILLLGIFLRGRKPGPVREGLAAVNEAISSLDDGKRVKYLDIGKSFLNDDGTISGAVMPDSLHLSRKGYRIWADAMEPTLWSMLDEPRSE